MTYTSEIEERIEFLQVDESTLLALRKMQRLFEGSIDGLLEDFYGHILRYPALKSMFANQEAVARARRAQKGHWLQTLFSKDLGKAQFDRAEQIGYKRSKRLFRGPQQDGRYAHRCHCYRCRFRFAVALLRRLLLLLQGQRTKQVLQ